MKGGAGKIKSGGQARGVRGTVIREVRALIKRNEDPREADAENPIEEQG